MLIKAEMIAATLVPLVLNLMWAPLFNLLTSNKYGTSNQDVFLILSFCVPFQYITNIIWSAHLAKNRLSLILRITMVTFFVAALGDIIFIPQYGARAAALVFLVAMIIEYVNYLKSSELKAIRETWSSLVACMAAAAFSGFVGNYFFNNLLNLLVALPLFFLILRATGQLKKSDLVFVLQMVRKKKT